jgi:hypothetical protein
VVKKKVTGEFSFHDYRNVKDPADKLIESYIKEDSERGVQLNQAPLVRMAAFQCSDEEYSILLTYHPIVLDGWSMVTILKEFFDQLLIEENSEAIHSSPPKFRDYIAWLQQRDSENAERWWRTYLSGFRKTTPLWIERKSPALSGGQKSITITKQLPQTDRDALLEFARNHRTTLNAMVQLSWGLLLGQYAETEDVVFGSAVSGRPPELAGMETMVGAFINNIPVRVRFKPNTSIKDILDDLNMNMIDIKEHEHTSPAKIQHWSDIETSGHLFDTLVLFQNFPLEGTFWESGRNFTICDVEKNIKTNFPLTLVCIPQPNLDVQLIYDDRYWDTSLADKILQDFSFILLNMAKNPGRDIHSLLAPVKRPTRGELCHLTEIRYLPDRRQNDTAGLTGMEKTVASIWQDVLGLDSINSTDNFFDLGGRSVQVTSVHSRLCELGYNSLSVVELFDYPTIAQLALKLGGNGASHVAENEALRTRVKQKESRVASRRERLKTIREHQE